MPALCFGCADGSRRVSGVRRDQTDAPEDGKRYTGQKRQHRDLNMMMLTVITQSWSWASAPAGSCRLMSSSESLPFRPQRGGYT